ncbi:MAG: ankyrin repeat domain-containing protein [Bacteroidales bacterium]|nr:ankyrin repeat domain-containing protein [Bacteroidales bacterium]
MEADNSAQVVDLLRRGANPNATTYFGRFALTIAAGRGNYEITKLLLDSGAYVNVLNPSRWTALRVVAQKGNSKIVRLLIDNGATLDSIDDFSIVSPFYGNAFHTLTLSAKGKVPKWT